MERGKKVVCVPIARPSLCQLAELGALEDEVVGAVVADCVCGPGSGGEGVEIRHGGWFVDVFLVLLSRSIAE
jgi:hypothetical protein